MATILILSTLAIMIFQVRGQVDRLHCRNPLGMQDKRIPDSHLTASSFHAFGTGPKYARLDREEGDGAWCPRGILAADSEDQYLQVELPHLSFLSIIATQGRNAKGVGQEYVPSYKLNYSRDGVRWTAWKNFRGDQVLGGNSDARNIKRQLLNPGIISVRYIRFIPVTSRGMVVCARIEFYGCTLTSGVISYEMPSPGFSVENGVVKSTTGISEKWTFTDDFYDGIRETNRFHGGLGQLTDGIIGTKDLTETKSLVPTREMGFDYVGWENNNNGNRYVTLTFHFEVVQNFTSMRVHCLSNTNTGSKIFSNIQVSFSLNGKTFPSTPYATRVEYSVPDNASPVDNTRFVFVPLERAMARYVRARFQIRGDWLLISEVEFDTVIVDRDPNPELMYPPEAAFEILRLPVTAETLVTGGDLKSTMVRPGMESQNKDEIIVVSTDPSVTATTSNNVAIIVGSLAAVIAILLLIVAALICRQRRLKKTMTPPRYTYVSGTPGPAGTTTASVTLCIPAQTVTLTPTASVCPEKSSDPLYHEITNPLAPRTTIITENEYLEPSDGLCPKYRLPEVTQCAQQSVNRDRRFEQPDVTMCASGVRDGVMTIPHYAETDVRGLPPPYATSMQGVSGNNVYAVPWTSPSPVAAKRTKKSPSTSPKYTTPSASSTLLADDQEDISFRTLLLPPEYKDSSTAPEFPRHLLKFVEKLGEGQFGEVRMCEADSSLRKYIRDEEIELPGSVDSPVLVAVKVLREDASPNAKEDFLKEVKVMSQLKNTNIVRLVAVCTEDEPYAMITEYMEHGDLNQYLQGFDFDASAAYHTAGKQSTTALEIDESESQLPIIRTVVLMNMVMQIASGMKYLASLNFVHRDLATRNCLVGADNSIRIADFGMSRNMYQSDYYKIQGKAVLPIRWMSWECVLLGKFSTASDVWAFGVTMWEIFTLCKCQPYHAMDDKEVIENMHHIYQRTGEEVYLPKPKACPTSVFNMVRECWKRECEDRPQFEQLFSFLRENV